MSPLQSHKSLEAEGEVGGNLKMRKFQCVSTALKRKMPRGKSEKKIKPVHNPGAQKTPSPREEPQSWDTP